MSVIPRREIDVKAVAQDLALVIARDLERMTRTCLTCEHFNEKQEMCQLANTRPPARIIAFGCEMYADIIPF